MKKLVLLAVLCACRDDGRGSTAHGVGSLQGTLKPAAGDLANTRYSPLSAINTQNVGQLKVAWTYDTGSTRGHEGAPLVSADTIYVVTPFPNKLVALDLTGKEKWEATVQQNGATEARTCCDSVNHGAALANGTVYFATLDAQVVAVDAASGAVKWTTSVGDADLGETVTAQPAVIGDQVLIGVSGELFGKRGKLEALDAATGEPRWSAYSTGPDSDVKIGPRFQPFYDQDRGKELGTKTWPSDAWLRGGGDVSGFLAYDPATGLVYHGTGAPAPWNQDQRPGDNKWTSGVFARDAKTGEAVWFYPFSSHARYPYDGTAETVLLDLNGRGVLIHPDANGYVYVLDRKTGEVLAADPFVNVTESTSVELKTGRLVENDNKQPLPGKVVHDVCPSAAGAKNWQPSAFSPDTGLLYIPHETMCMDFEAVPTGFLRETPYIGANLKMFDAPDADGKLGALTAWDPVKHRAVWSLPEQFPVWGGALATAGGLVFYGTMDGDFRAVDAKTGKQLWSTHLPSGVVGQPVTFEAGGRQYVAVYSGVGGWAGSIVTNGLDPHDKTAARGFADAMKELPSKTQPGGRLYVFAL
jgi:PQQ-dependent dehydrogenase (methanol/ethanol family)